jgi:hypothetical protein
MMMMMIGEETRKKKIQPEYVVTIDYYQCQALEVLIQFTVVSGITGRMKLVA